MERSNNDKMIEILRRLKPEMNGAVTEEMEKHGICYGLNYGVSIPVIRRVARDYAGDHSLAGYLFRQDVRELKLAAIYIDDPRQVTEEQMERWAAAMSADELMEHAVMRLFHASPEAEQVIRAWFSGNDSRRLKGALHMAGRRAEAGIGDWKKYLEKIGEMFARPGGEFPFRPTVYALCRIAGSGPEPHTETWRLLDRLSRHPDHSAREIAAETVALLEYSHAPALG